MADYSPIFLAIKQRDFEILEVFCDYYADEFDSYLTQTKLNPLHFAFSLGHHDVVDYLSIRCGQEVINEEDS